MQNLSRMSKMRPVATIVDRKGPEDVGNSAGD